MHLTTGTSSTASTPSNFWTFTFSLVGARSKGPLPVSLAAYNSCRLKRGIKSSPLSMQGSPKVVHPDVSTNLMSLDQAIVAQPSDQDDVPSRAGSRARSDCDLPFFHQTYAGLGQYDDNANRGFPCKAVAGTGPDGASSGGVQSDRYPTPCPGPGLGISLLPTAHIPPARCLLDVWLCKQLLPAHLSLPG